MTLRIALIAHGFTDSMRIHSFGSSGQVSRPAAESLRSTQRSIGRYLPHSPIQLTSPSEPARASADLLGWHPREELSVSEINYGIWSGLTVDEIQTLDPEGLRCWLSDPSFSPKGGESVDEHVERVGSWLSEVAVLNIGKPLVVMTHASVLRAAVIFALGSGGASYGRIDIEPWSILRLSLQSTKWRIRL